eukprot:jgi/Mesvir1/27350/Mv07163-RA.2
MPYEFVPSVLLTMGVKAVNDPSLEEDLMRVRGAIFLGSNRSVLDTKWGLDPPLAECLQRSLGLGRSKIMERGLLGRLLHWLSGCQDYEEKPNEVVLGLPFEGANPQKGLDGPLFKEMTHGKSTRYTAGAKVVVRAKGNSSDEPITIVGTIVAFKPHLGKRGTDFDPDKEKLKVEGKEYWGGSGTAGWYPSGKGATECIILLRREPPSLFPCPEGVAGSPHLWEVSSRDLREGEDPEVWISKELANVPGSLAPHKGASWPPSTVVCHQPVEGPSESATHLVLTATGSQTAVKWAMWQQNAAKPCNPMVRRRVFLRDAAPGAAEPTATCPERELASLAMSAHLCENSQTEFRFPGFPVHKPGSYRIEYSLEEPQLPWSKELPRPVHNACFEAVVGPPKTFDLDFPSLSCMPVPGPSTQAGPLPAVRLNEPFEVAVSFFDKERAADDEGDTNRNACTEFDPAGLRVKALLGHGDALGAVHALVGAPSTHGKGQPLCATLLLSRVDAHRPARVPLKGIVQTVMFTLEGPSQKFPPFLRQLLLLPGPAVSQTSGDTSNTGGEADFVGLEGTHNVVNHEGTLSFKVRFHDSEGNETRCFLPHSRVKLRITCAREGAPPEVLLERCALFGEDGSLTAVPEQVISKAAANACQGALVLDEEGDIAVRDLRFSLDFSGQDPAVGRSANHVQAVDIRVSLEVPPAGRLSITGAGKAEAAPSEISERRPAQGTEWSTITKAKTLQVLPSSRPSRVRLCYQDGKIWRESLVPSGRRAEGGTARTKEFQLQRVVAGQSLPQLAIRVETEAGQKLLGPDLEGEGHKAAEPAREMPDFEREFAFKLVAAGGKYSSTPAFQSHGVLPRWELPCEAGRHVWEFKVRLTRRAAPPGVSQPLQGKEPREWPALELKQKIRVVVCVDAGPHAGWSLAQIPDLAPEGNGVASGAQPVDMGMGARSHRGPPRLTLGQPLSQSGLALVPVDEFGNAVVVEEAPTLRVVPQGAAENGQETVTFLAEALPVVLPGSKVDGGKAPVGAPGPVGHEVAPMDTLPGSYLRKVAGAHGQPSNYFCFCSASEAYLYRQEPLPSSTTASSSTGQSTGQSLSTTSSSSTGQYTGQSSSTTSSSATGQSTGVLSSTGFALELSSEDGATSRVDVDIANPGIGGGYFICVHGMPYEHLMSWQEHTGVWAEVRVLLPGGHSVRAFDERRDIRHMLLEAGSPGLQLQARGQPGFPRVPARFNPQEVEQAWGGFGGAVAATPVVPAVHAPGALAASRLEDGTYQFPPFFTVHEAPNGPMAHGGVAASTVVRAEMAHAGVNPPQEATVQFTWRRNPYLVTRLDISVEGGGPSERHVVAAGSPLPPFQIKLEGQDGATRFATVNDAPNLRVDLVPVRAGGRSMRLRPPKNLAPEEELHFSHRSLLETAGTYRVSATWWDARTPDPSAVVTSFCFIDIIPGPPAKLATSNWRLRCCDNSGHKPIFDHLMVHCTDSHGNNTTEYRGGVQLSVVPIYIPAGGDVQAAEYAMLADGNPIFEMRRGELNIPRQYLRVGVGRVDGDYALRVETVPDTRQLEPLQLGFKFINLHGLSREVENVTQRMWDQQGTLLQRLAEHYVRTQEAHQRYELAQQICEEAASDAHFLLPGLEPREALPQMYQEACEKLGALAAGLNTARTDAYREVEVREEDLRTRRPKDGLTERQRRAVNEARRDGHAYGTLPMIAVVEDADDARLLSWLTRDYTKAVLLTAGASAAVRQRLKVLGLNVIATGRVTAPDFDDLPRALSQAPGNPRPAASLLELKKELFQGDPETAEHIMGIIQTLIGNVLVLDRAEDAERLAEELWGMAGQGYDRPVLPPIISRDGGYLRDSNGMEWSAATLQAQLRRRPAHVFGPPTRENCRGLVYVG